MNNFSKIRTTTQYKSNQTSHKTIKQSQTHGRIQVHSSIPRSSFQATHLRFSFIVLVILFFYLNGTRGPTLDCFINFIIVLEPWIRSEKEIWTQLPWPPPCPRAAITSAYAKEPPLAITCSHAIAPCHPYHCTSAISHYFGSLGLIAKWIWSCERSGWRSMRCWNGCSCVSI